MVVVTPFSVGIAVKDVREHLTLGRKILDENDHILIRSRGSNLYTNFKYQQLYKHLVNENYVNLNDIELLKSILLEYSIEYLKKLNWYSKVFKYDVSNFWLNKGLSESFQEPHNHLGSLISGSFYIDQPEGASPIRFYNPFASIMPSFLFYGNFPDIKYDSFNSEYFTYTPNEGTLFLWPSYLTHEVPIAKFNGARRNILFDINVTVDENAISKN